MLIFSLSVFLTFFPLIGTLGFEFAVIIAFFSSFISIYVSAEFINLDLQNRYPKRNRYSDIIFTSIFINFFIILVPLIVGLVASLIKSDCYIKEGLIFFFLIPVLTTFFASSLGLLIGYIFPKRGFFIGSMFVLLIVFCSLWQIYVDPPVFSYNHIFGFFPGPIYDQIIPIDQTLIVYRFFTLCCGGFFLVILKLIHDYKLEHIGAGAVVLFCIFGSILLLSKKYENELGIRHTRDFIINKYFLDSYETENFTIYFPLGSRADRNIELIVLDHEWRYSQLSKYLEVKSSEKIVSYIYPDENTRKKLIGAGRTTIANPIQKEIHLIYDSYPHTVLKHELTHVLSSEFGTRILKISPKWGLVEGLAVAADWQQHEGYSPHQWSRAILSLNGNYVEDIVGWGFLSAPVSKSYMLMGSFVRYLIDTYGIDKFKIVYKSGKFDIYNKKLNELIDDWEKFLMTITLADALPAISKHKFSQPSIFNDICPRKSAYYTDMGIREYKELNYYNAIEAFKKSSNYNPTNKEVYEWLAYSYFFNKDYSRINKVLENNSSLSGISKDIILNLVGTSKWIKGDNSDAQEIFNIIRDKSIPIDVSQELDIKIDVMTRKKEVQDGIKEFYSTRDKINQVSILENLVKMDPDYGVPYYLLGRLFFYRWEYNRAQYYLEKSEALGLPTGSLNLDSLRLLGVSLFANGKYKESQQRFEKILQLRERGRYNNIALDFIERIEFLDSYSKN